MSHQEIIRKAILNAAAAEAIARMADVRFHTAGYAEPNHDEPSDGVVVFGDWSEVGGENGTDYTLARIPLQLHKAGIESQQITEWTFCSRCRRAVRTQPDPDSDHTFWRRSYFTNKCGERVCRLCVSTYPSILLDEAGGSGSPVQVHDLDLPSLGYFRLQQNLEFHRTRRTGHDPVAVAVALRGQGLGRFLFEEVYNHDDDLIYTVWLHSDDLR